MKPALKAVMMRDQQTRTAPVYRDTDRSYSPSRPEQHAEHAAHHDHSADERVYDRMTRDKATEWMQHLKNEDPAHPTGPRWTMDEVKPVAQKLGVNDGGAEFVELWAAMNMLYSDYYPVLKEYGVAQPEVFAKLAKSFLHDKDAKDHKLSRYYHCIVSR